MLRFVVVFISWLLIMMLMIMLHDDHHHYVHSFSFVSFLHHQRRYYNSVPYKPIIINNYLYNNNNQHVQTYNNYNNKKNNIVGTTTTGTTWYTLYMSSTSNDEISNDSNNTITNSNNETILTTIETNATLDDGKDDDDTIGITNQTQQDIVDTLSSSSTTTTTTISDSTSYIDTNQVKLHENWSFIQSIGAITGRGEFMLSTKYSKKTQVQYLAIEKVIQEIEHMNPIVQPTLTNNIISGTWELLYSTTYLFRQSPFFLAGRAVCTNPNEIDQYNWFCTMHRNALSISQIQSVRQIINSNTNQLISEFEVNVGAIPFLSDFTPFRYSGGYPISITGAIVSTADITPTLNGTAYEIYMDTVQIKGSNIPLLRNVLDNDNIKLQSRVLSNILQQQQNSNYNTPKPIFRITYLDEQYRICRDIDDHIYVYVKTSNNTTPADYTYITPDLGIGRLLESFNDAIIKFYI